MNIFPNNNYTFKIIGKEGETLERLKRRTDLSESLTSKITDKSFRGLIKDNTFKIISSEIGKGAFCVLTGEIINQSGQVNVEINKAFRILLRVFLCIPFIGLIVQFFSKEFSVIFIPVAMSQVLMIRYIFIEIAFRKFSKSSLNRLGDVLDIEHIQKVR